MDLWATVPYYTAYLSQALLKAGADVKIGSVSYYLDPGCFSSRGLRLDPGILDLVGRFRLPAGPRRVLKLAEALLNMTALAARFLWTPPAVVHVQYLPLLRWGLPVERWFLSFCRMRGARIVLTVHDLLPHDTGKRYQATFAGLYASADHLICHSESVRTKLTHDFAMSADKISVIPHGPFFYDLADSGTPSTTTSAMPDLLVLWQGIIFPYKGVDVLLRAWKIVEKRAPNARLLVMGLGDPDLLRQLREQANTLGIKRATLDFRFLSAEELVRTYRAADAVVYPYRAITTSGALATGLALGKAIVASDLPVFRELLHHEENALLAPPDDSECLAEAIIAVVTDPALRHRLAANVRTMNFGEQLWSAIVEATMTVYKDVCFSGAKEHHG